MEIIQFGHKRIPSREGGVEIVVEELSTRLAAMGHKVTCCNRGGHHVSGRAYDGRKQKEFKGVRLITVPTLDKKGLAAVTSSLCAAVYAAFSRARVVHIHAEGPAFMCWLPRLFGKRVIVTVHGLDWQRAKWQRGFGAKYIRWGEKMAVRFAHEIIVLSRNVQNYFRDTYDRETVYIPNGVTPPAAAPEALPQGLEKDGYFLFLGRLVPEKEIHTLIDAFRQVDTHKKLVIAGGVSDSGDYARQLEELAKGDDRIRFAGFVQGDELAALYANAYVYILPSRVEGMPLTLLEAMSYGNCCLVSDIAECAEVVQDRAVTFPVGDTQALAATLARLDADRETVAGYKACARDYICEKYSWDTVARKTLELYQ